MTPYVVCIGLATRDTVVAVPRWPEGDDRVVAGDVAIAGGGPAATAAVALARLGVPTYFVGSVGDDDVGDAIRAGLEREGVDTSHLGVVRGARPRRASSSSTVTRGRSQRIRANFRRSRSTAPRASSATQRRGSTSTTSATGRRRTVSGCPSTAATGSTASTSGASRCTGPPKRPSGTRSAAPTARSPPAPGSSSSPAGRVGPPRTARTAPWSTSPAVESRS
jgi:hypothetical protein